MAVDDQPGVDSDRALSGVGVVTNPSEALQELNGVLYRSTLEACRRSGLVGASEAFEKTALYVGPGPAHRLGWYTPYKPWRLDGRPAHEIVVNADHLSRGVEDVFVTCLHEAVHAVAHIRGVDDTSRSGRYHNRRFAEMAMALGCNVVRDRVIGVRTDGLTAGAAEQLGDLLGDISVALRLTRTPVRTTRAAPPHPPRWPTPPTDPAGAPGGGAAPPDKFLFLVCKCVRNGGDPIVYRLARGAWPRKVRCERCCSLLVVRPGVAIELSSGVSDTSVTTPFEGSVPSGRAPQLCDGHLPLTEQKLPIERERS